MRKTGEKQDYHEHDTGGVESGGAACANECTGLMYRVPENQEEQEAYRELTPMEIPAGPPASTAEKPRLGKETNSR